MTRRSEHVIAYSNVEPNFVEGLVRRSWALHGLGRYEEGLAAAEEALKIDARSLAAQNNKAMCLFGLSRYKEALQSCEGVLKMVRELGNAWDTKGQILEKLERYQEALAAYDKALTIDPKNSMAQLGRSRVSSPFYRFGMRSRRLIRKILGKR